MVFLGAVRGWASLFLGFLVFSSVQLFCLGLVGEYIGRIYIESKRRPLFVIKEVYRTAATKQLLSQEERLHEA